MWISLALGSAVFAGLTSILAKIGIKNVDSNLATALRTIVVTVFAWVMVFVVGSWADIAAISTRSLVFLILSGFATGSSWLCYFKALQLGDVNKVVPIDKSSTVLTMLLALMFLGEAITMLKAICMLLIALGTYLMIERKDTKGKVSGGSAWFFYAIGAAVFASLTAILSKIGIDGVESNLGTAIRTIVVLVMAWAIVIMQNKQKEIKNIDTRSWVFIAFSGVATGLSWLCYYRALQEGPASVVVPIDKLSILVTVFFGYFVLGEKLKKKPAVGLAMIVGGTLLLLV